MSAAPAVSVAYAAPVSCPGQAAFSHALVELGMNVLATRDARRGVSVELLERRDGYTLLLRYNDEQVGVERRELGDAHCEVLVQSAATMVAVWSGLALPAVPPVVAAAPPVVAPPARPMKRAQLQMVSASLGPSAVLGVGDEMLGAELGVRAAWSRDDRLTWALSAGLGYARASSDVAQFQSLYLPLLLCPGALGTGQRLRASLCLRSEFGLLQGQADARATPAPETQTRAWGAAGASVDAQWAPAPWLALGLELAPELVFTRDSFTVAGREVMKPDFLLLRCGLNLRVPLSGAFF